MVLKTLAQVPLFQSLSDDELEDLIETLRTVDLEPGSVLFRESDPGDHFYVILEGRVEILRGLGGRFS
ncbi:cyclic nucleotide-binding domain-containing protein [bacterium]|nr:MAG: cyclic nucleotide-binding domain-containing protein [bacterium]